jgi:hypothetical protein
MDETRELGQRHFLATQLRPGRHELTLRVLMANWKAGQLRIDGIEARPWEAISGFMVHRGAES